MRRETRLFMIWGAVGCALGGLLSEFLTPSSAHKAEVAGQSSPQNITLVIDTSGSMDGGKLEEVKSAASSFVQRQDLNTVGISVVGFGSQVDQVLALSHDTKAITDAIDSLQVGGGTNMGGGLLGGLDTLKNNIDGQKKRTLLLFTDGVPEYDNVSQDQAKRQTLEAATQVRNAGIQVLAVATEDADQNFLGQLTGDPALVFPTSNGNFGSAFKKAEQAIKGLFSGSSDKTYGELLLEALVRSGLAALVLGAFLLIAQNILTLRGRWSRDLGWVPLASGALGAVGGVIGQLALSSGDTSRAVGWLLLGAGTGLLLGLADRSRVLALRGALGGAAGGFAGGVVFQILASIGAGGIAARLISFAILGAAIGLMVQLIQQAFKGAWLYGLTTGPYEGKEYILAKSQVTVGRSDGNDIGLYREEQLALKAGTLENRKGKWFWAGEAVLVNGMVQKEAELHSGDRVQLGNTEFVFRMRGDTPPVSTLEGWTFHDNQTAHQLEGKTQFIALGGEKGLRIDLSQGDGKVQAVPDGITLERTGSLELYVNEKPLEQGRAVLLRQGDLVRIEGCEFAVLKD